MTIHETSLDGYSVYKKGEKPTQKYVIKPEDKFILQSKSTLKF